ncbi:YHYH protein [Pseudoalteromonas sp. MMG010]|uniref:YHYH protein n=1 Tax=Pseudoalteromonas sp. MMG010 TaxID=2822685 RepID=UPI001B39D295|nr:YHYH protein [Pseudoalteromonas sp. MMG010]MBQ4833126.1 YHYH protein [Pseudoalteromonas sp. MMG010]
MKLFFNTVKVMSLVVSCVFLTACGSSSSDSSTSVVTDSAPSVDAGVDQVVEQGDTVTLSGSVEDDGDYSITWAQTQGTNVSLSDVSTLTIEFVAPTVSVDEVLEFELSIDDGTNDEVTDTVTITVLATDDSDDESGGEDSSLSANHLASWLINNETTSTYIQNNGAVVENVQSAQIVTVSEETSDVDYMFVSATDIPKYDVTLTQAQIDALNNRPKAASDFANGVTSAEAGQTILFGEDIGYNSSSENCDDTGGAGYWPPGPGCPTEQSVEAYFPVSPAVSGDTTCETGLGTVGLMVNGTSIFNWGDGMSYGNNVWYTLAPIAEQYDVDVCGGHAANGEYHHHFYTSCLAELVNDDGDEHSPIYGFAADGYPLYGPYESDGQLALSGWAMRDYGASESLGGCDTPGERTCTLVDQYDISKGVESSESGPDIGESVTTLSGNTLTADDGYYFEDYYYTQTEVSGAQLDEHNGHDTNDGKGYHYHITLTLDDDGNLSPAFPYQIGPRFKGELADNSFGSCDTGDTMGPPPQG